MSWLGFVSYLQSLPRATWKVRVFSMGLIAIYAFAIASTFDLSPGFAMTWVARGFFILVGIINLPPLVTIAMTGRMTRNMTFMFNPASYRKTFSETRSDIADSHKEERARSREL